MYPSNSGYLEPLGGTEHLPFQFERTASKQLPVYSDLKNGGTRRLTVVRKYTGDVEVRFPFASVMPTRTLKSDPRLLLLLLLLL
jgi:hypothetical protein